MERFKEKVVAFSSLLCNAYRSEEKQEIPTPRLTLGEDMNEDLIAMIAAMKIFCDRVCPQIADEDLIGFTYILNRMAIQHCYGVPDDDEGE